MLATGLTAAILVGTISPQAAQATPKKQTECTTCHGVGAAPGLMQINFLGPTTMAPNAEYALQLNMNANVNDGQGGWWIAESDASGATGAAANVCRDAYGVTPPIAPACYGGPALSQSFSARLTAPAAAGTYYYKVFMVHGVPDAQETYTKTFSITVTSPATTAPPTTTEPTDPPTTTEPTDTTTTTAPVVTTTEPTDTTTTTAPVVVAGVSAVIPVGAPNTGAGGASGTTDGPLVGLGGLTLLLAGAGATTVIRRRRQA